MKERRAKPDSAGVWLEGLMEGEYQELPGARYVFFVSQHGAIRAEFDYVSGIVTLTPVGKLHRDNPTEEGTPEIWYAARNENGIGVMVQVSPRLIEPSRITHRPPRKS